VANEFLRIDREDMGLLDMDSQLWADEYTKALEEHMSRARPAVKELEVDFSNYGEPESYIKGWNDATTQAVKFLREETRLVSDQR
jgi:hypothetical protein